jgi:hypothetical protein
MASEIGDIDQIVQVVGYNRDEETEQLVHPTSPSLGVAKEAGALNARSWPRPGHRPLCRPVPTTGGPLRHANRSP